MSYSLDFRKRVFKIKAEEKLSDHQVCYRFGISTRTLYRGRKILNPLKKETDQPSR